MKDLTDITDRLDKQRGKRRLEPVRGPAQLLLFPLCDSRGLVSQSLGCGARPFSDESIENCEAEGIFFAWLLELPTGIDAADAARAVLLVSGVVPTGIIGRHRSVDHVSKESSLRFRKTMIGLLQRVRSNGSLFNAPEKIPDRQLY